MSSYVLFSDMMSSGDSPDAMFLRGRIVGMHEVGTSVSEISQRIGITRQSVQKWVRRWEAGEAIRAKPRSGRPRCTTTHENEQIVETARREPVTNAVKITQYLGLACSATTTRKRIKEAGLYIPSPNTRGHSNKPYKRQKK